MADIAKITLKGESEAKNFIDEALRGDIAYEELSTTVSKAGGYVAGDHLIYLGQYYEVVADIAQGGTIVTSGAGQNVEEREVGDEIKKNKTQYEVMPVASADYLNRVITYIGATTATYTSGQSYQCVYDSVNDTYSWEATLTNQVKDMNNVYGSKNLLIVRQYTRTYNGVSITVNDDGSISFKGTPSAAFNLSANTRQIAEDQLKNDWVKPFLGKECIFSSNIDYDITTANITIAYKMTASDTIHYINSGSRFTFNEIPYLINVSWYLPTTLSFDTTWKPMIRLASIEDDTHEPYAKTNQQLTEDSVTWNDLSEVGAVNYCKNKASSTTTTDGTTTFTWTVNDDKSVTVSAPSYPVTVASHQTLIIWNDISADECKPLLGKTFKLTGCPSGGGLNNFKITGYRVATADGSSGTFEDFGNGNVFTWGNNASGTKANISVSVRSGYTMTGPLTFKPMLTDPSYNGPYVPYAKTNQQLTQDTTAFLDSQNTDGCKNHFGTSMSSSVNNGLTYQNDGNNIITANGTVTASPSAAVGSAGYITGLVVGETYVLSGLPESTALSGGEAFIKLYNNDNSYSEINTRHNKTLTFTYDGTNAKEIDIGVRTVGTVVTNAVFKPMICLKSLYDADPTFAPYAKSNKELTDDVSRLDGEVIKIVASGIINANSSRSFTCTDYEGYRLSIYSIGGNAIGMIVLFGKHPSVDDVRFSTFYCENRNPDAPQVHTSGSTLTITTSSFNCYYVIERIKGA